MQSMTTMTDTLEMQPETQVKTSVPNIIKFVAFNKNQLPVTLRPLQDETGMLYTGQGDKGYFELLTNKEIESLRLTNLITADTVFVVEDGKQLDISRPMDAATWAWVKRHSYITLDKEGKGSNNDAVFYIANPEKEAKARIDNSAKIDEARPAVRNLSESDRVNLALALGLESAKNLTPIQVLDWLLIKANEIPETVLKFVDPGNAARVRSRVWLTDALRFKTIAREKDGAFYFGGMKDGITLGHTEEMVVDYLLNPQNVERVKAMKSHLAETMKQNQPA